MPIPDFESAMRPVLVALSDGQEHSNQQIRDAVAADLGVTQEERQVPLPSGRQPLFTNRVAWAIFRMKRAGLLVSPARAKYQITPRGLDVLARYPDRVDRKVLATFPEYVAFMKATRSKGKPEVAAVDDLGSHLTPSDAMQQAMDEANSALQTDLLERVYAKPPEFLERLALDLMEAMGYGGQEGRFEHTGKSGDKGLDGVVRQDALGLERIGLQAKRYEPDKSIPGKDVQAFVGALDEVSARLGVFVTTAGFSKAARDYAGRASKRVVLIDGQELTRLMVKYGVALQAREIFTLQEVDDDYFED